MEIIPAIMPKSIEDLKQRAEKVSSFVSIIQLDLMDGNYVEEKTWPFIDQQKENLPEGLSFELDLMVLNAENDFEKYLALNPKRIIFHARSIENKELLLEKIKKTDIEIGIALLPNENEEQYKDLIENVDFIQVMGIENIGYQGEAFSEKTFSLIKTLKEKYPNVIISVDGGVSLNNAKELKALGVDRLVSGSTIFKSDNPGEVIKELLNA